MATFLELCQAVYREGGISGEITSVQNQSGEALRVVRWVQNAYLEILNDQGMVWNFLHSDLIVQLTAGKSVYSFADLNLPSGVQWDTRAMRVAVNSNMADETHVLHMRFPEFRDFWLFSSRRDVVSRPLNVAVNQDTNLVIAPIPDQDYYLAMRCETMPPPLIDETDIPVIPTRFHMAIAWKALRHYGMFEAAQEVVVRAETEYRSLMNQLYMDQTPEVVTGGALC